MESFDYANLIYASLLLGVILLSVLVSRRNQLGQVMKQATVWLVVFLVVVFGYGMWTDIQGNSKLQFVQETSNGDVIIPKRPDGHYYATLLVNDTPINFLIDTGATQIVLNMEDAKALGFDPETLTFWNVANTANGQVRTAPVRLETMALGPYVERNFRASVNEGDLRISLLGMEYLNRFASIQLTPSELRLSK